MAGPTDVVTLVDPRDEAAVRRARDLRRVGLTVIGLVLLLGLSGFLGIRTATTTARSADGRVLEVQHAQVTRAGIAAPLHITVRSAAGFDAPVVLSISSALLERFDFQNFYPNPSAETATGDRLIYEFDPPPGRTFRLNLDARTAPDQNGSADRYQVAVLSDGKVTAEVSFRMWVMP